MGSDCISSRSLLRDLFNFFTSLCTHCVAKDTSFLHADREDSDQTGRMPRLI